MDLNPMAECLKPAALLTASMTCNLCLKLFYLTVLLFMIQRIKALTWMNANYFFTAVWFQTVL